MPLWCSHLSKITWIRLSVIVIFVLVNVALYTQSKHIILNAIFPQFSTNLSQPGTSDLSNGSDNNNESSKLWQGSLRINSTDNVSLLELTRHSSMSSVKYSKPFFNEKIVNPHNFGYPITPKFTCSDRHIELIICVAISHDNYAGRDVIRNTWGTFANDTSNNASLLFFIGSTQQVINGSDAGVKRVNISEESLKYGDILQEDFIDSYSNLSLKSVSILKWVSMFCSNAKFILKADDDMYVNVPFLVKIMREYASAKSTPSAFIVGSVQEGARPIRDSNSKWYTPVSAFPGNTYPKYTSGTAYAMTGPAAYLLYEASLRTPIFWLEDIYITGLCANKASVDIYNSGYFTYGKPSASGCSFRTHVSGHRYSHQEIMKIHEELYDPKLKC